jgi:hypothetical protein
MPWPRHRTYPFEEESIRASAPAQSGLYALYTRSRWIYFGESDDIQGALLARLRETGTCIKRCEPDFFACELCPSSEREAEQKALVEKYHPECNSRSD